jgi:cyclopropane fatty-acyl-phospholipid synthase-like methyltransferase
MSEYERWEGRYTRPDYEFGEEPAAFLARQKVRLPESGRALAVSDGEGRNGVWLARQGLDVVSMDFSPAAQAKAQALAAKHGVAIKTELADIMQYTWPHEYYDVIAAIFFQYLDPAGRSAAFAGVRQALRPGGLLLLSGYTPKQLQYGTGGPKTVEKLYTRPLLEQEFAGFAKLEIDEYDAVLHEGTGHNGMSALIDFVGTK